MDYEIDDVVVSEWNWFFDGDGDVRISGFLQNNSGRPVRMATPQFRVLDGDGSFLGVAFSAREFNGPLPPGASGAFHFYDLAHGRDIAHLEYAGVVDVQFADE